MIKKKERLQQLKKEQRGDAMIVVLCVLMVLMVLSVTLLMAVSPLLGTARKNAVGERCRALALSFNDLVEAELLSDEDGTANMRYYIRSGIEDNTWAYYDPEDSFAHNLEGSLRSFQVSKVEEKMDGFSVYTDMYWTWNEEEADSLQYSSIQLVVVIRAEKKQEMYQLETTYDLEVVDEDWLWVKEGTVS